MAQMRRKITINGNPITQAIKTLEETHELLEAVNRKDQHEIRDAIGDIIVTLIMQCKLQGMTIEDCLFFSFQEIKDRKGELNEVGDFIKKQLCGCIVINEGDINGRIQKI